MKKNDRQVKIELIIMMFLQLAVLGGYIISLGGFLASRGMASHIGAFYAMGGLSALVMPTLVGALADRRFSAQRLYGVMHLFLALALVCFSIHCRGTLTDENLALSLFFFLLIQLLYIPTLPLSISICFAVLNRGNMPSERHFPFIRMFGTLGFVFSMVMVDLLQLDRSEGQFLWSAVFSIALFVFSFVLPDCPPARCRARQTLSSIVSLLRPKSLLFFFLMMFSLGMLLKTSESYINPFLVERQVRHVNSLMSLSRISEAFVMLLLPLLLRRLGFRKIFVLSALGWSVHFGMLGLGYVANQSAFYVGSMLVYGIAYNCFITTGTIWIDRQVDDSLRSTAQGLLTTFQNGLSVLAGALLAQWLFNNYVYEAETPDWLTPWLLVSAFALLVGLFIGLFFRNEPQSPNSTFKRNF